MLKTHKNPPAFKFYESVDILLHKKVGDTRVLINEVKMEQLKEIHRKGKNS